MLKLILTKDNFIQKGIKKTNIIMKIIYIK